MNNLSIKKVATVSGLFLGAFALSVLAADWTEAPCAAPGCNTAAPINVSRDAQTKLGGMILAGGDATPSGAMLDVDGVGSFTGLSVAGRISSNFLTLTAPGYATENYVLTNTGGGNAEWKPISANGGNGGNGGAGGFTPTVAEFSSAVVATAGMGQAPVNVTDITGGYKYCSLSKFFGSGTGGGTSQSGSQCNVYKSGNDWKLSASLNPASVVGSASLTCQAVCFK